MSAVQSFAGALSAAGSAQAFEHDGLIYTHGVPAECVRAYAGARLAKADGPAILAAMVSAYMDGLEPSPDDGRSFVWMCARAWAGRLASLERQVRGIAA